MKTKLSTIINDQSGLSMFFAMILVITTAFIGMSLFYTTSTDLKGTKRHIKKTKAGYVAESALGWAKSIIGPEYVIATHDSTGLTVAPETSGSCGLPGQRIAPADLASMIPPFYAGSTPQYDGEGFIFSNTTDPTESLSGSGNERMSFKVFYPTDNEIQIIVRGEVNDEVAEISLSGNVGSIMKYGIISNGDLLPFMRRSESFKGDIHTNGNLYLTPMQDDGAITQVSEITAGGSIFRSVNPYHAAGDAKAAFINANQSSSWRTNGLFPASGGPINFDKMWQNYYTVTINGLSVSGDDPTSWSGSGAIVKESAAKVEIPSFEPPLNYTASQGPGDCDCSAKSVRWTDLVEAPQEDWIFNPQYGTNRIKGETYPGWHARNSLGWNGDTSMIDPANIQFGTFTQNDGTFRYAHSRRLYHFGEDLEDNLTKNSWTWKEAWYGGGDGGHFIRGLIYDLSKENSYPRKCPEGGVVDFDTNVVIVINADSLHYPISVYSRRDIYIVGDFNVGWNAKVKGIWEADTSQINGNIASNAIKGASIVADSARVWYLTPWFLECQYGFGDYFRNGTRDGWRGRSNNGEKSNIMNYTPWESAGDYGSLRWYNRQPSGSGAGTGPYHYVGVFVGVFVSGAPMLQEGFYVNSRAKGIIQPCIPPVIESIDYNRHWMLLIGTEVYKSNAKVEGDWNPATNSFDNSYWNELQSSPHRYYVVGTDTLDRYAYWRGKGHGSGFPPRPGYVAPRIGRGYRSFFFQRDLKEVPEPPGIVRVLSNESVYSK